MTTGSLSVTFNTTPSSLGTISSNWVDYSLSTIDASFVQDTVTRDVGRVTLYNDSWCSQQLSTITSVEITTTLISFCVLYDGVTRQVPFNAPIVTSSAGTCLDSTTPIQYQVPGSRVDRVYLPMDVDPDLHIIYLTPMIDGSEEVDVTFYIRAFDQITQQAGII